MRLFGGVALAVAVATAGCGGSGPEAAEPVAAAPVDARERACRSYGQQVEPFLRRFNGALDRYQADHGGADDDAGRADAVRDLADFLGREVDPLRRVSVDDRALAAAHVQMVASLDEHSGALEQQATGLALDDRELRIRSLKRRSAAWSQWSRAFEVIVTRCGDPAQSASGTQTQPSS